MSELRMLSLAGVIAASSRITQFNSTALLLSLLRRTQRSAHDDAGASLFDLRRGNRRLRQRRMSRGRAGRRQRRGSFFAIQAADLRWLSDLWAQLADESRPLDRQAIAKRLADVLENAEFF